MALINRFTRLFTADLHAVLDRIEEPDTLLKQAVREMEDELTRMRAQAKSLRSDLERLRTQEDDGRRHLQNLEEELDVCFESGEESLARSLVKRKIETERHTKAITAKRDANANTLADVDATIAENQHHLSGMHQKLELLVEQAPTPGPAEFTGGDYRVDNDEVEVAFLREKQRREHS